MTHHIGLETVFFYGIVEDVDDPIKAGRVRVRPIGWYSDDKVLVPTNHLPWAQVVQAPNSAALGNVGHSPTGMLIDTWVFGIFIDGKDAQQPLVLGSISGVPDGIVPDVNQLARGDVQDVHPVESEIFDARKTGIQTADGQTWNEPVSDRASVYPDNHVYETQSGHIQEFDDTAGAERLTRIHKTRTYEEIAPSGNRTLRVNGDGFEVIVGNKNVYVTGKCNVTIDGDANVKVVGDLTALVDGNADIDVLKDADVTVGQNATMDVGGTFDVTAAKRYTVEAPLVDLKGQTINITGTVNMSSILNFSGLFTMRGTMNMLGSGYQGQAGTLNLSGQTITIDATSAITMSAPTITIPGYD